MHSIILRLIIGCWFLVTFASALVPRLLDRDTLLEVRNQSPDGTCGGIGNHTCDGSEFGKCCSMAGWCGSTTAYCLTAHGCQSDFGECIEGSPNPNMTTPSLDGMCGGTISCADGPWDGACCSGEGFCGSTDDYCSVDKGCQRGLGKCKQITPDGTCGGDTGFTCANSKYGVCCSEAGWCGSTNYHCGIRCQSSAGPCLAPSPDGTCGVDRGYTCLGSSFGECCSSAGWCGNTTEYCSTVAGCNAGGIEAYTLGACLTP